jgi:hypothetical protein
VSNLILALITVAIVIAAITAFAESSVGPQATMSDSIKAMEQKTGEAARTTMSSVSTAVSGGGATLDWRVRNSGQTKLRDFPKWDLLVRYHGPASTQLRVQRLAYTTANPPGAGEWTVTNFYAGSGGTAEVYEPGIVNPGEEFNVQATLSPVIGTTTSNSVTVSAPNGVYLAVAFTN